MVSPVFNGEVLGEALGLKLQSELPDLSEQNVDQLAVRFGATIDRVAPRISIKEMVIAHTTRRTMGPPRAGVTLDRQRGEHGEWVSTFSLTNAAEESSSTLRASTSVNGDLPKITLGFQRKLYARDGNKAVPAPGLVAVMGLHEGDLTSTLENGSFVLHDSIAPVEDGEDEAAVRARRAFGLVIAVLDHFEASSFAHIKEIKTDLRRS